MYIDEFDLTKKEKELLKEMEKKKNSDGFYELSFFDFSDWKKDIECELEAAEDEETLSILNSLYEEYGEKEIKTELQELSIISVVNRAISGNMTDEWFRGVVHFMDTRFFVADLEEYPQAKDLKILYLYRVFTNYFSPREIYPSEQIRSFIKEKYLKYAEKKSEYILELLGEDDEMLPDNIDDILLKEIKESF